VVAAPAYAAADVLRGIDGETSRRRSRGSPTRRSSVAPVGIEAGRTREPIEGFGFLVPREESLGLLGCLFMSQLFPGPRAGGHELLHCMLGGVRWPEAVHLPDAASRLDSPRTCRARSASPIRRAARLRALAARRAAARARPPARMRWLAEPAGRSARARTRGSSSRASRVGHARVGVAAAARALAAVPFVERTSARPPRPGGVRIRTIDEQELLAA
jgi:hypothetical protein